MTSRAIRSKSTYLRVRGKAKGQINQIARRHRLTLVDTAEVLIAAFESMTPDQQRAVIERSGDQHTKEASAA